MSTPAPTENLQGRVASLMRQFVRPDFPGSARAAFKRWAPGQPPPLAYYRLLLQQPGDELPASTQTEAWMLLAWALSQGIEHQAERSLGRALAEAGYAEARLERLLAAAPELLPELAAAMLRFLAAKAQACNLHELARLLLTRDDPAREVLHRRLAIDFFRHLPRPTKD